jgi:hypothetical protein
MFRPLFATVRLLELKQVKGETNDAKGSRNSSQGKTPCNARNTN